MSNDLAQRTKDVVMDIARQISLEEVTEEQDIITAGFDSIATMEFATRLEEELGVACSIEDVFDTPSLAELARILTQRVDEAGPR